MPSSRRFGGGSEECEVSDDFEYEIGEDVCVYDENGMPCINAEVYSLTSDMNKRIWSDYVFDDIVDIWQNIMDRVYNEAIPIFEFEVF